MSARERIVALSDGQHVDADTVGREALPILGGHEQLEAWRLSLIEGNEQIERGDGNPWTPELMDRFRREAAALVRQGHRPHADVCP